MDSSPSGIAAMPFSEMPDFVEQLLCFPGFPLSAVLSFSAACVGLIRTDNPNPS